VISFVIHHMVFFYMLGATIVVIAIGGANWIVFAFAVPSAILAAVCSWKLWRRRRHRERSRVVA